jgi:hypothetical protein
LLTSTSAGPAPRGSPVAGQVDHGADAGRPQGGHRGGDVAGVVHGGVYAEVAEEGIIVLTRPGGADHVGSAGRGELYSERADAPGGARDEHGLARQRGHRVDGGQRGRAGQAQRTRHGEVQPGGDPGRVGNGCCDVLAERAVAERGLGDHAEHNVARPRRLHAGTGCLDGAGEVPAEHDREAVLDHPLQAPVGDRYVEPVDRAGPDPDEHLALFRLGGGQVVEAWRGAEAVDGDGSIACSSQLSSRSRIRISFRSSPAATARAMSAFVMIPAGRLGHRLSTTTRATTSACFIR